MKKFGYWFIAYAMILLSIAFLWDLLIIGKDKSVQTSVMAKSYQEVSLMERSAVETELEKNNVEIEAVKSVLVSHQKKDKKNKKTSKKNKKKKSKQKKSKSTSKRKKSLRIKEEKKVLERIVEAEAGGQDEKGRILVANVILNRVEKKKFPNTVRGVVFAYDDGYYQFSPIMDGRYNSVKVSKGTKKAVSKALSGVDYSKGALYFMNRRASSSKNVHWFDTRLTKVLKHGAHEFFK